MNKISVIIPVYKEVEALDLCLESCIRGCNDLNNIEVIIVVDGFYDLNKEVLEKWSKYISILNLPENVGMIKATNLGVYNASNNLIFTCGDDNIFPEGWDHILLKIYEAHPNSVISPNQIEPIPSMFSQFYIEDMGRDPKTFSLEGFWLKSININKNKIDETGSTFPFLISKLDYLKIGGIDESYPGPWTCDWEFFMKCQMNGMKMIRAYDCHFYHFVSLGHSTPTIEKQMEKQQIEMQCHEYAKYKWGTYIKHDPTTNLKYL